MAHTGANILQGRYKGFELVCDAARAGLMAAPGGRGNKLASVLSSGSGVGGGVEYSGRSIPLISNLGEQEDAGRRTLDHVDTLIL